MSELVTNDIAKSVLDNIIEVNATRRNYDSSSDERRCISLKPADIANYRAAFSYNVGTVSDGTYIRLDETEIYFRLPVNISMIESQSADESYIYRASDRAASENPSLQVFVDGLKIPDSEILFYPTKSNVDVFVPLKYVDQVRGSEFIIEKILYDLVPYIRFYAKSTSLQIFNIHITEDQFRRSEIRDRTVQIYINKTLYSGTRTVSMIGNTNIQVSLFSELQNAELEIIVDPSIQYFFPATQIESTQRLIYSVPESYIDSIHGPLSKFSCYFYMNGKRLMNTSITQIGRLHFACDLEDIAPQPSIAMCVTDREFINDTKSIIYGSDYYLYNFIGCNAIDKYFKEEVSGTIFDEHIDWNEVLNNSGKLYDRQLLNKLVSEYEKLHSPSTKVSHILDGRPYSMRTLLEQYGNKTLSFVVEYSGRDSFVYFGLPDTYELSNTRHYDISINTYHVPTDEISIVNKNITDVFKIDAKYFSVGKNTIDINIVEDNPVEYETFEPKDINVQDGFNTLVVDTFKRAKYSEDICILEKVSNDASLNYDTDKNIGYRPITDAAIEIDDDGKVYILFETVPTKTFIVYNKNFSCLYTWTKPLTSGTMDIIIPIYTGSDANPIPFIPRGKLEVYAGNEKLISGIDYFVKDPTNEKTAAGSFVVIKRAILPGTNFDIYISNMKTKQIIEYPGYFTNNKYGLFYLGSLNYPVSLKYLNIYLNNKKVSESDIDILSDKLIRIHSFKTPMYDLSVESTFSVEEAELTPYINLYKEDDFEKYIESLFKGVYYNRPYDPNEGELPDFNKIYESFIDTVDSVNKRPNPTAREEEWIPSDNTDPDKNGVYNDGTAMGGEDINGSIISGGSAIFAGGSGRVASCKLSTLQWYNYNDEGLCNDGSFVNFEDIKSVCFCKNYVVFGTSNGKIGVYDVVNFKWYSVNSLEFNLKLNKLTEDIYPNKSINKIVYDDSEERLMIMGDGGNVATYSFKTDTWYPYSSTIYSEVACVSGIIENIYDGYITHQYGKTILVVAGSNGKIASCKLQDNAWTTPEGKKLVSKKTGPSIFHDGSSRNYKDIKAHCEFLNYTLYVGEDGVVTVYDSSTGVYTDDKTVTRNIANTGTHSKLNTTNALLTYESSYIVAGSDSGKISNYSGDVENWRNCDFGGGLTDDGEMMDDCDVRSILYTIGENNFFIFSGEKGKVCTYNVDVHEVPYRYDPYKTAFLKWYTTPGNAVISTIVDISEELATKFSMYHDSENSNYDISVAPGDLDLIADIYMNDLGTYPYLIASRVRFLAEMIQEMGDGRYTFEEAYKYYVDHKYNHMLYDRDIVPLKGCALLDVDYDIKLT